MRKIAALVPALILLLLVIYLISSPQKSNYEIKEVQECSSDNYTEVSKLCTEIKGGESLTFDTITYLQSGNYCKLSDILSDLQTLDSLNSQPESNRRLLASTLTLALEKKIDPSLKHYNFDSLHAILYWADQFYYAKELDTEHQKFYRVIHRHWYNYVANKLSQYYDANKDLSLEFQFNFLAAKCTSMHYPPDLRLTTTTKILQNLNRQKWAYLAKRFWFGTGTGFKIVLLILGLFTLYAYYCAIINIFKRP